MLTGLFAFAESADAQRLAAAPREDELDAALLAHHSTIYDRGLADGRVVWFIVDPSGKALETGVADSEGLEESLQAEFPAIASNVVFELDHMTVEGRAMTVLWMLSEPPGADGNMGH